MEHFLLLRKCTVIQIISKTEYIVEDIFDKEKINMTISNKFRMNYFKIEIGEEVYVSVSPFEKNRGRIATTTSFKGDNELYKQKVKLDERQKEMK